MTRNQSLDVRVVATFPSAGSMLPVVPGALLNRVRGDWFTDSHRLSSRRSAAYSSLPLPRAHTAQASEGANNIKIAGEIVDELAEHGLEACETNVADKAAIVKKHLAASMGKLPAKLYLSDFQEAVLKGSEGYRRVLTIGGQGVRVKLY